MKNKPMRLTIMSIMLGRGAYFLGSAASTPGVQFFEMCAGVLGIQIFVWMSEYRR